MLRELLIRWFDAAVLLNQKNIISMLEEDKDAKLLDLGCANGEWTLELGRKVGSRDIYGVELTEADIKEAQSRGVKVIEADLNQKLPLLDNFFDVVHANQVIEHLHDTDNFVAEIYRILKPGGYAVISSENLSSWHNIFSLVFGWQPFSMANFSSKGAIGNPLSLWRKVDGDLDHLKSWQHMRLFSYRGLKEIFERYRFTTEAVRASGYYPMPTFFATLDPRHGHFISMKFRKTVTA